jgi:hypothetical protein
MPVVAAAGNVLMLGPLVQAALVVAATEVIVLLLHKMELQILAEEAAVDL